MGQIIATLSEMRSGQVKVPLDTRTKIIVVPDAMQCEIVGKLFDPGKTFLGLDSAVEGLRYVHRLAARVASGKDVLIVAHTEPLSDASKSEQLSRDRAAMVAAWFEGDVEAWLDNYADSLPSKERWGTREDQRMLSALGGFGAVSEDERPTNADARYDALVRGFQRSRGLTDDGIAGPVTRKQLVQEYFALAKVDDKFEPVPTGGEPAKLSVNLAQHGAGPHFSLADAEAKRQAARAAAKAAANSGAPGARPAKSDRSKGATSNRAQPDPSGANADTSSSPQPVVRARVDIFIFFSKEGMEPAPGSADGEEFLEWVGLASGGHRRFRAAAPPPKQVKLLPLPGGCFRTGSAVLLPGTSMPVDDAATGSAPHSSTRALAMALRFNEERPGHRLLIAGHTDSVGSDKDNDQLSKQRAQVAHAVMMGDRDTFVDLADRTGKVSDWKQILGWASLAFPSIEELVSDEEQERAEEDEGRVERAPAGPKGEMGTGFSASDPGTIDDDARSAKPAVEAFQTAYNENYKLLGGGGTISVDGIVGKQTWGAIYDLYQYNLAQELGEDFEGLKSLRDLVEFLPTKDPYIGFGEHHPADGNFKDNTESHANRRVEVLFFEQGHEPDLEILDEAPELSEMYENGSFIRSELEPMVSARRWQAYWQGRADAPGRPGNCFVRCPGANPGTVLNVTVSARIDGETVEQVSVLKLTVETGKAVAAFEDWGMVVPQDDETKPFEETETFPKVEFQFSFEGGGRIGASDCKRYADELDVTVGPDAPQENEHEEGEYTWLVYTPWGIRTVTSDDKRRVVVGEIPPGGARLEPLQGEDTSGA